MKKRIVLPLVMAGALIAAQSSGQASKPNVLLICVDDLKPLLGCYGDAVAKSPQIDRLAQRGVVFERAYCTQAVCAPSRNALMTGLRSQTLGIYDLGTNFRKAVPDAVTVAQYFRQHGYRTEAMGKIMHVGHGNHEDAASWSIPHWRPSGGGYVLKDNLEDTKRRLAKAIADGVPESKRASLAKGAPTECADVADNEYADGKIADEAVLRLRAAKDKPEEPFFIAVGFLKPHLPFCAPKKYWDLYSPSNFRMPALNKPPIGAPDFAPSTWGELRSYTDIPAVGPLTEEQTRHLIHGYHAAVSYMDAQFGRVLDALDETGLAKNTVVLLWGDHGWHLGDHGMWCKHTNYEQAARIPFIIAAPGFKSGAKTRALMETVDIYPTLCELAGLPQPKGLEGASVVAALKDPGATTKEAVLHVYPRNQLMGRAVRTDRFRLVEWKKSGDAADTAILELYDYEADPLESKNLAEEQPAVVAKLRAILARQPEAKPQIRAGKDSADQGAAPKKSKQDRGAMFDGRDKDKDGKLTREEFLSNQPDPDEAPKRFPKFDKNGDGVLDRDEFIRGGK